MSSEHASIENTAFQEALLRARKLAEKVKPPGPGGPGLPGGPFGPPPGGKRPFDDDDDFERNDMNKRASFDRPPFNPGGPGLGMRNNANRPPRDQCFLEGEFFGDEKVLDFMLPGNKVGFVIGKGGEMIRTLQDKAGVKMNIIQDSAMASEHEKQLRITGPPDKVDYARKLVQDLLFEKEQDARMRRDGGGGPRPPRDNDFGRMSNAGGSEYGGGGNSRMTFFEYPVSPQMIGLVIGKGGETIRKIQAESGCKVQFDTQKLDGQGNKICQFTGTQEAVNKAVELVKEIIENISGGSIGGGGGGVGGGGSEELRLAVPASRTGSVIGRGGETIRQLKSQSGCNIELDKNYHNENDEKCFIIRGPAEKLSYAQQLISEKVAGPVTVLSSTAPQFNDNQFGYLTNQIYNQVRGGPSAGPSADQYSQWPQPQGGGGESNQAQAAQYAMWAQYYAQYYQQQQPQMAAAMNGAMPSVPPGGPEYAYDEKVYRQWIDYYKACGLVNEAAQMEKSLQDYKEKQMKEGASNGSHHQNSRKNGSSAD